MRQKRSALLIAVVVSLLLALGASVPAIASDDDDDKERRDKSEEHDRDDRDDDDRDRDDDDDRGDDDDRDDDDDSDDDDRVVPTGPALSTQSWTGALCDGTSVALTYSVFSNTVSITEVVGPDHWVERTKRGERVSFGDTKARIAVSSRSKRNGQSVSIDAQLGRCSGQPPPAPPPTAPPTPTTGPPTPTTAPPPTPTTATTTAPTTAPTTATTTAPTTPPTPAPTTAPTTAPPTTAPVPQKRYLAYQTAAGEVVIEYDPQGNAVNFWAVNSTEWKWFADKKGPGNIKILFAHIVTDEQAEFSMSPASTTASFKSDTGGTVSVAPSSESTTAPATTGPSGP